MSSKGTLSPLAPGSEFKDQEMGSDDDYRIATHFPTIATSQKKTGLGFQLIPKSRLLILDTFKQSSQLFAGKYLERLKPSTRCFQSAYPVSSSLTPAIPKTYLYTVYSVRPNIKLDYQPMKPYNYIYCTTSHGKPKTVQLGRGATL